MEKETGSSYVCSNNGICNGSNGTCRGGGKGNRGGKNRSDYHGLY